MITQTSKIIALAVLAGAIVSLTGCHKIFCCHPAPCGPGICQENLKAGFATIRCQPMDTVFTDTNQPVHFHVEATGDALFYEWHFVVNDGTNEIDTMLEESKKEQGQYYGVNSTNLTIVNPTSDNIGHYYCEIDSINYSKHPARTQTRQASLGYSSKSMTLDHNNGVTAVQPLPVPGSPHSPPVSCLNPYCTYAPFNNGGQYYNNF